jgi:hypothetical protein
LTKEEENGTLQMLCAEIVIFYFRYFIYKITKRGEDTKNNNASNMQTTGGVGEK